MANQPQGGNQPPLPLPLAPQVPQQPVVVMPNQMPNPLERRAPRWTGKEKTVAEWLRSFEMAAQQAGLTDLEMRMQLGLYCKYPADQQAPKPCLYCSSDREPEIWTRVSLSENAREEVATKARQRMDMEVGWFGAASKERNERTSGSGSGHRTRCLRTTVSSKPGCGASRGIPPVPVD